MSSCLSSRACGFDLEHLIKWPCSTSGRTTSDSSSPSSTLSESSNSPIAISSRKPRTRRKRPNQTYHEAAALLSMACPNIFSTKHLTKKASNLPKFTKQHGNFFNEPPELILPFPVIENSGFLLRQPIMEKPCSLKEPKVPSSEEIESNSVFVELSDGYDDEFDTESMLDEEIEQGIDSIMGDSNSPLEMDESNDIITSGFNNCYGYPMGLGFGGNSELNFGFVMRNGVRALKKADERNFWSFPMVKMVNISPPPPALPEWGNSPVGKKTKKKKKKKKKKVEELMKSASEFRQGDGNGNGQRFILKLDYDAILNAWSDKGSPLAEAASPGAGIRAHIDLLSENGGWTESGATRSIDNTNFKKIRYQVKNVSSDRRPRCKGRFVTKANSPTWDDDT